MKHILLFCLLCITMPLSFYACNNSSTSTNSSGLNNEQSSVEYTLVDVNGETVRTIEPPLTITNHGLILASLDYGCGSTCLATILKYTFNEDATEQSVIEGLMKYGDTAKIEERQAFSLLDMKKYLVALGYTGTGYSVDGFSLSQLQTLNFNAIAQSTIIPITINNFKHFIIFRGYDDEYIYIGDPAYGNICFSIDDFALVAQKVIFVVGNKNTTQAQSNIAVYAEQGLHGLNSLDDGYLDNICESMFMVEAK